MEEGATLWAWKSWALLTAVRSQSPLIQCITNFVSMDLMANTLLSAGASPALLHTLEEIPDFTPQVHALCLNVGTLSADWLPAMKLAAELAQSPPTVIRGNASEIIALANASVGLTKGVDSSHESHRCSGIGKVIGSSQWMFSHCLIAAFVAVDQAHALEATAAALSLFGIAGEMGMKLANGPASLRMHLIDSLHGLDEVCVLSHVKIASLS
ncbi:hypothetical protein M0R45_018623 [Rubus argutus]|uniref:hydroxyethylthiazole kinase n=1 Tax=Rubus argutus TaxID=59490 RepID=A0AAW1X5H0_RUBAR